MNLLEPALVIFSAHLLMSLVIKNLPALQLRDSNPYTVWSQLKMDSTVAIQGGTVWLSDRGNNREVLQIGGWDGETEEERHKG